MKIINLYHSKGKISEVIHILHNKKGSIKMKIKKRTKYVLMSLAAVIIMLILFFSGLIYNTADGNIYIKINDKTYIANDADIYENNNFTELGTIEDRCLPFIKPTKNSQSNGFPVGVKVYQGEESDYIYVEEGQWLLRLNLDK